MNAGRDERDALLVALAKAKGVIVEIPKEWKPSTAWGESWGITRCNACHELTQYVERGWFEMKKFAVANGGGVRMIPHYRMTRKCPLWKCAKS